MNILCIGLAVVDVLAQPVDARAFNQDSTRLDSLTVMPGGDALNTAIQCAKLGNDVSFMGVVGHDMFASVIREKLSEYGIIEQLIVREDLPTSVSLVMIDAQGDRVFIYHGKANDSFNISDIDQNALIGRDAVHLGSAVSLRGMSGEDVGQIFKMAKAQGAVTSLDVSWSHRDGWREAVEPALHHTDYFMPSMLEAKHLAGSENISDIRAYFSRFPLKALVVKLGAQGSYITDFRDQWYLPIYDIAPVVDTTGAGDTFAAGFLTARLRGHSLKDSAYFGNVAAAHCVTEVGATAAQFTWDSCYKCIKTDDG